MEEALVLVVRDSTNAAIFSGCGMEAGDGWAWAERDWRETLPVEKLAAAAAALTVPALRPGRTRAAALEGETIDEMALRDNIIAAGIVGYLRRRRGKLEQQKGSCAY